MSLKPYKRPSLLDKIESKSEEVKSPKVKTEAKLKVGKVKKEK